MKKKDDCTKVWTRTVSTRGRITIPKELMRNLKVKKGMKPKFEVREGSIFVKFAYPSVSIKKN